MSLARPSAASDDRSLRHLLWPGAALAASIIVLWGVPWPLGVPGEWTWPRIPFSAETAAGWILCGVSAALYVGFVWCGGRRVQRRGRLESAAWLCGLVVAAFVWLSAVQSAVPGIAGWGKAHFVLYYPRSSGYFWQARYEVEETAAFLAGYEDLMRERDYLHIGTHPPGLTLCFRGLLSLCRAAPELSDWLLATQPDEVRASADEIRTRSAGTATPYTPTDVACVWLATLLVQLAAAATVVPLTLLLREVVDRQTAWFATALWPLVPAVAIFLPKSDTLFPFIGMLATWLWMSGWRRGSLVRCSLAGLTLCGGLLLSLAFLPVGLILGVWTAGESWQPSNAGVVPAAARRRGACLVAAATAFLAPIVVLWAVSDINLAAVWQWNFRNHALFYEHNPRTYWKWLLINPMEFALAAGGPLAALATAGIARSWRAAGNRWGVIAFSIVWLLLWLSGKNMGEAARLWIFLLPWLVFAAAGPDRLTGMNGNPTAKRWLAVLALQSVACVATATRIDGFHFAEILDHLSALQPADDSAAGS